VIKRRFITQQVATPFDDVSYYVLWRFSLNPTSQLSRDTRYTQVI